MYNWFTMPYTLKLTHGKSTLYYIKKKKKSSSQDSILNVSVLSLQLICKSPSQWEFYKRIKLCNVLRFLMTEQTFLQCI